MENAMQLSLCLLLDYLQQKESQIVWMADQITTRLGIVSAEAHLSGLIVYNLKSV